VKITRGVFILLAGLLLIVLLTMLLVAPQTLLSWAGLISELPVTLRVAGAILLDLLLLALIYLQIRPSARVGSKDGLVMRASDTITEVSVDSTRERILNAVSEVPDVVSVETKVTPVRGKADVDMQVVVVGSNKRLPEKQNEISRAIRQVVNKQLGLELAGPPRIQIRLQTEEETRRPVTLPPPSAPTIPVLDEPRTGAFSGRMAPEPSKPAVVVATPPTKPLAQPPPPEPEPVDVPKPVDVEPLIVDFDKEVRTASTDDILEENKPEPTPQNEIPSSDKLP
jgi:hypothetical protein